ncbi:MotE family protein [Acidimangrovimonas pyrenivorans]|uniref:MotE family protein n=1 Tax=Acidimangrovimonas pyrenivorans TaxID=2030798 RepID=A0ABV7AM48_9RHOB
MVRPPPLRLLIGVLALAGAAKAATSLPENSLSALASGPAQLLLASAQAEGGKPAAEKAACQTPEELLQSVRQERDLLKKQKAELDARRSKIDLAQQEVAGQTKQLGELKTKVEALLAQANKEHQADVDRLVQLYQAMKPAQAAAILNDMDIEVTVMVLATMNERNAAPIMAQMSPVRVRAVSKIILERSKLPGDQNLVNVKLN